MITLVLVTTAVVIVVQVGLWYHGHLRHEMALRTRMKRDVIVTLHSEQSFSGVLFERDTVCLVLRNAVHLQPQGQTPVDGELLVRWAEVAYVQLP